MKDAEGKEIISNKLYRNFGATTLDFNSAYSKIYFVKQLSSGLVVAKDEKGVSRRVWSHEEISEMYEKELDVCMKKVRASELYLCNNIDILIMQENLERSRKRTPGLISLLNNSAQSQPKCTIPKEMQFPFPHEDSNSPGYNPFKRGGDNPNPLKKY